MRRELRYLQGVELRQRGGRPVIRGYAARFNSPSLPLSGMFGAPFTERIMPGAFAKSIQNDDVRALVNHDPNQLLGRTKSGTLALREDEHGLFYEITPPDTTAARDVIESIKRGDMDGSSFGFSVPEGGDNWVKGEDGKQLREVREVKLYDISPVTYPAYPSTSVAMRSLFPDGMPEPVKEVRQDSEPDGDEGNLDDVLSMIRDAMSKLATAHKALGGTEDVLTVSGDLTNENGGDDKTQQPSRSYEWMSPELQRFYRQQDRKARMNAREDEFERMLLTTAPDSNAARMLKLDRELAEIKQEQAREDAHIEKDQHHERWRLKDPCAIIPLWRDINLYPWKAKEKEREKDPWAAYPLL
jgi:HK97 family phage prohead protease